MKTSKTYIRSMVLLSLICLLCSPTTGLAKIYQLTILHTNEHKGHLTKFSLPGNPDVGGMAARSTLVNIVRAEVEQAGGFMLLLSAGDVNRGTPESDLLYAEPDFKVMKMLGYDAITLGNLDFNNPREVLMKQREWAGCPFLAADLVKKKTGELLFDPYIIKEFDGLQVAIFGLTLEEVPTDATYAQDLGSRNVIEIAQALVPKLKADADIVIALTHIELDQVLTAREAGNIQLAQAVPGIDVIVGGQTRIALEEPVVIGDTLIVQAGDYGRSVGRLDLTIDSEADTITDYTYTLIPVNLKRQVTYHDKSYYMYVDKGYVEDPAVLEFIQPYLEQTDEILSEPVGETLVKLDGNWDIGTSQETNLGNLVTDAMRSKTGAQIAFCVGGSIRADIEPGPITYRDILLVSPYLDRTLVLLDMTGDQVMEVFRFAAMAKSGTIQFLQVSGLTWTKNKGIPENVRVGDAPIESDRMYKVVTPSDLAAGRKGYTMLKEIPQFDTGFTVPSALREYIKKAGKVAPKVDGRLTIIK